MHFYQIKKICTSGDDRFTAAMTALLPENCCPCSPFFIIPDRWKSGGTNSSVSCGYGRTVQPRSAMCSMGFKLVWGLVLEEKGCLFLWMDCGNSSLQLSVVMQQPELMVCLGSRQSRGITLFLFQRTLHIFLPTEGCVLNFFSDGKFTSPHQRLPFWLWTVVVTPRLFTPNDVIQEIFTFSLVLVQQVTTKSYAVFILFLCEHLWDPHGSNTVTFQQSHHFFQHIEANIQLHMQTPRCNLSFHMDELMKMFFTVWYDSCVWPGPNHQNMICLSHCCCHCRNTAPTVSLYSHPLFGVKKCSASVDESQQKYFFFCMEEINSTLLLQMYVHIRCRLIRLPLCCHLSHRVLVGRFNPYCHTSNICPLTLWATNRRYYFRSYLLIGYTFERWKLKYWSL